MKFPLIYIILTLKLDQAIVSKVLNSGTKFHLSTNVKYRIPLFFGILVYVWAFYLLYHKYVPQISTMQLILIPIIVSIVVLTSISIRTGTLFLVFCIPLLNSIPNFFELSGFNPLMLLFFGYFLGVLIHQLLHLYPMRWNISLLFPILGATAIVILSALITIWRYTNFFPLFSYSVYDLAVNVLNISAGEAIRRVLFDMLNYLAGFLWFFCVVSVLKTKEMIRKSIVLLAISTLITFTFGLIQAFANKEIGNTDLWVAKGQINALFTDPNAFGVYLVLIIPLFAGALLTFKKYRRLVLVVVLLMGTVLIPHSGSRSGFLGLVLAALFFFIFVLRIIKMSPWIILKKTKLSAVGVAIASIVILILALSVITTKESVLYKRVVQSLDMFSAPEARMKVLNTRQRYWLSSYHMIREFPVSGIGIGAFTCELPNYYIKYGTSPTLTSAVYREIRPHRVLIDSAGNYYLQVGSELGVIGLLFFMWIFFLIIRKILRSHSRIGKDNKLKFLQVGVASGILSLFVIFLFGVHTLSFEIQMLFWLMVGILYSISDRDEVARISRKKIIVISLLVAVFAVFHGWNSIHALSLQTRTSKFKLVQSFGFYQEETIDGRNFMWTRQKAGMPIKMEKPVLLLPLQASHPDIEERPLRIKIYATQTVLKDRRLLRDFEIKNREWQTIRLELTENMGEEFLLVFEVSRTWQPFESLGSPDSRHLGIAIGDISFDSAHPTEKVLPEKIKRRISKYPRTEWKGKQGADLNEIGRCWMTVSLPPGEYLFRLGARGEKAENEWPYLVFWIDDELVGETWVSSSEWKHYCFRKKLDQGQHKISVVFANGFFISTASEDRDLLLDDLEIFQYHR